MSNGKGDAADLPHSIAVEHEEIQKIWDDCLVRGWLAQCSMGNVFGQFLLRVNPDLFGEDLAVINTYINGLELNRCRDRAENGLLEFNSRGGAMQFIAARSPQLNACLLACNSTPEEVIENIIYFKWTRRKVSLRANKRRRNRHKNMKETGMFYSVRERDKSTDWKTVK